MTKTRIKPPTETKTQLMLEIEQVLPVRFDHDPVKMMAYLLNYFTAIDLVGIRDDLRRLDNNGL